MGFCSEAAAPTAPPRRAGPWIRTQGTWFCSIVVLTVGLKAHHLVLPHQPPAPAAPRPPRGLEGSDQPQPPAHLLLKSHLRLGTPGALGRTPSLPQLWLGFLFPSIHFLVCLFREKNCRLASPCFTGLPPVLKLLTSAGVTETSGLKTVPGAK